MAAHAQAVVDPAEAGKPTPWRLFGRPPSAATSIEGLWISSAYNVSGGYSGALHGGLGRRLARHRRITPPLDISIAFSSDSDFTRSERSRDQVGRPLAEVPSMRDARRAWYLGRIATTGSPAGRNADKRSPVPSAPGRGSWLYRYPAGHPDQRPATSRRPRCFSGHERRARSVGVFLT
jgi:hypothetical protein